MHIVPDQHATVSTLYEELIYHNGWELVGCIRQELGSDTQTFYLSDTASVATASDEIGGE